MKAGLWPELCLLQIKSWSPNRPPQEVFLSPCFVRTQREGGYLSARKRALTMHRALRNLDLGLPASRLGGNKFLLFEPLSRWYVVMAVGPIKTDWFWQCYAEHPRAWDKGKMSMPIHMILSNFFVLNFPIILKVLKKYKFISNKVKKLKL